MASLRLVGTAVLRGSTALLLPFVVPAVVVAALWALPGDPVAILCPVGACTGQEGLAAAWGLDGGPVAYYQGWLSQALTGDLGRSWRLQQGASIGPMVAASVGWTGLLVGMSAGVLATGGIAAARGLGGRGGMALVKGLGLLPAVVGALLAAAAVELWIGPFGADGWRLAAGILVLSVADGALGDTMRGAHATLTQERSRRYVRMARLRGESELENMLPNVLPTLVAHGRGRVVHLLSGAVVVEVVLGIPGLGDLLFDGTLLQDFGVVLAATWVVSLACAALLMAQAGSDVLVARWVTHVPEDG